MTTPKTEDRRGSESDRGPFEPRQRSRPRKRQSEPADGKPTRYDKLNTLQKYRFGPIWELNAKTRKRNLILRSSEFDERAPRSWLSNSRSSRKLSSAWQDELEQRHKTGDSKAARCRPDLLRAIRRTFGASYLLILACIATSDFLCEPTYFYLCVRLIEIIGEFVPPGASASHDEAPDAQTSPESIQGGGAGELYAHALLFLAFIVSYQLLSHPYVWLSTKMGFRLRVALSEMVYKKALRMDQASQATRTNHEQALNIISRDLDGIETRFVELAGAVAGPIQCLVFLGIVSLRLDIYTALVVFVLNAAAAGQRSIINFRLRKYARLASEVADRRMGLVSETMDAIRLVRMYAWTRPLEDKIDSNRREEMRHRERQLTAQAFDVAFFFVSTSAAALLSLMFAYYVRGLPFSQSTVSQLFLVTASFRRALTRNFTQGLQAWAQILTVIERCQDYLTTPDKPSGREADANSATESSCVSRPRHSLGQNDSSPVCKLEAVSVAYAQAKTAGASQRDDELDYRLRPADLSAREGELVLVAGQVGAGKSTLLQLVLREMAPTSGLVQLRRGTRVAYASQKAWIFSGSVRENILLRRPFDLRRYYEVIRVCALLPDLDAFPDFDRTRIGERGVTLSGGQKARINLARALYQQADLYLLDDPLSAVDVRVCEHIFSEALRGFLDGKTIILVTHQVQYLKQADKVLFLTNSDSARDNFFGTYDSLLKANLLDEMPSAQSVETQPSDKTRGRQDQPQNAQMSRNWALDRILSNRLDQSMTSAALAADYNQDEMYEICESRRKNAGRVETSKVGRAARHYFASAGTRLELLLFAAVNIGMRTFFISLNIFLNFWAGYQLWLYSDDGSPPELLGNKLLVGDDAQLNQRPEVNWLGRWLIDLRVEGALYVAGAIWLGLVSLSAIRTIQFRTLAGRASYVVHKQLIHSLLWAKLSFFDRTPQGHLINRLASDVTYLDTALVRQLDSISLTGLSTGFVFASIVLSQSKLLLVVGPLGLVAYALFRHLADLMELIKYLDGFRRANLYSHVCATLDGLAAIRAAGQSDAFNETFRNLLDRHSSVRFLMISVKRLIIGTVDWLLIGFYTSLVCFTVHDTLNGNGLLAFVGLNLVVQLTRIAQNTLVAFMEFYLTVQSMDRIREYATELNHERVQLLTPYIDSESDCRRIEEIAADRSVSCDSARLARERALDATLGLEEARFSSGSIRFSGVSLKFVHTNKLVLDDISFTIEPGAKVGIIGRTGAGKSSLVTVLFHLYHFEGFVYVGGQNTKQIQLESLRKSISIIPQDPCLFTGSIRHNLDPFNEHPDEKLWRALEVVRLKHLVQSSASGLGMTVHKAGANFSIGQRQLVCLARAMLKDNKILIMDEATANIDQETDALIQLAIKSEFKHCTVLTIAHRLATVAEVDNLIIMEEGRIVEFGPPKELFERDLSGTLGKIIADSSEQQAALMTSCDILDEQA